MTPSGIGLGFAARLSALYAALFVLSGMQLPFFPVWLKAKGLDAATIGLVLAVPMVVRVAAIPFATRAADRRDALRATIVTACAGQRRRLCAARFCRQRAVAIFAAYALASLAFTPIMPLTDAYALKGLAARGRAYGPVRLWGSAAVHRSALSPPALPPTRFAPRHLIWLIVGAAVLYGDGGADAGAARRSVAAGRASAAAPQLLRDPTFLAVVAAASLIQASHAVYYGFSALAWRAHGLDGAAIAALWALGVIAEIVLFALQARLPPFFTPLSAADHRRARRRAALDGDGVRPAGRGAARSAAAARRARSAPPISARSSSSRAHAPPGQAATAQGYFAIARRAGDGGGDRVLGLALCELSASALTRAMALAAVAGGACAVIASPDAAR